jgi:hypothetical protein
MKRDAFCGAYLGFDSTVVVSIRVTVAGPEPPEAGCVENVTVFPTWTSVGTLTSVPIE